MLTKTYNFLGKNRLEDFEVIDFEDIMTIHFSTKICKWNRKAK